eukprot:7086012-Pyramimonas_sp.AAC.1
MVEHQSTVALRGRMYIYTHSHKDTCSTISAHAEVSCMSPTSPRYYIPEVRPRTSIGILLEYTMHDLTCAASATTRADGNVTS